MSKQVKKEIQPISGDEDVIETRKTLITRRPNRSSCKKGRPSRTSVVRQTMITENIDEAEAHRLVVARSSRRKEVFQHLKGFLNVVNIRHEPDVSRGWRGQLRILASKIMSDQLIEADLSPYTVSEVSEVLRCLLRRMRIADREVCGTPNRDGIYHTNFNAEQTINIVNDGLSDEDAHKEILEHRISSNTII